ncbi:hypothetical protein TNCV_303641 [Trichonephila clavipes]|nr:hypothetical protein TNCV_303641 [Trichonephila clavipes]
MHPLRMIFDSSALEKALSPENAFAVWDTLNSSRAVSPLVRLGEGEDRWDAPDHPRVFSLKIEVNQAKSFCHMYGAQSYE